MRSASLLFSDGTRYDMARRVAPRQYYQILPDWLIGDRTLRPAAPCPGVVNFWDAGKALQHNKMNSAWQWFWFNLNRSYSLLIDLAVWNVISNSKAFLTDGTGTDNFQNFPNNTNLDAEPARIETKGCVLNVVCIVGQPLKMWHDWYAQIETLDITSTPPTGMSYASHPHLIHHANNLTTTSDGHGGFIVRPFDHFKRRGADLPVLFPLTSRGAVYYPLRFLEKLPLGSAIPNPYNPPMTF